MRTFLGVLTVALAALPYAAIADSDAESDLKNPRPIEVEIDFEDDGVVLRVTGEAEGLTPGDTYISLIYDIGSEAEGPDACEPTIFDPNDPNFILETMVLGFWNVDGDGDGTLSAINTNFGADYVPLSKIGAVSIRNVDIFDDQARGGFGPHAVLACGEVDSDGDSDSDSDSD
jgi:hypothetical protein